MNRLSTSRFATLMTSVRLSSVLVTLLVLCASISQVFAQPTDFLRIGNEALNQRKYEIAIEYYNKALMFQPNAPQAIYNRGLAYSRLGQDSLALIDYGAYLEIFPDNPTTYIARGVVHYKMGRKEQAIADLTKALKLDSTSGIAWAVLGDTYLTMRDNEKALEAWKNSVERDPKGPYAPHVREQIERVSKSVPANKPVDPTKPVDPNK